MSRFLAAALVAAVVALDPARGAAQPVVVSPAGPVRTVAQGIAPARPGGRVVVRAGTYREPTIVVERPVEIVGEGDAVLDGEWQRQIMIVTASNVTVRGLRFRNVGTSFVEDRSALRIVRAHGCTIEDNVVENGFFGIYLAGVSDCRVARNVLRGDGRDEVRAGNGIHLWSSHHVTVADNRVSGHRDGIYFEFVRNSEIVRNTSERNVRYGLHFMYSDDCRYRENAFLHNGAGVAVMYTKRMEMLGNRFEQNWGSASYGLLLKEIVDSRVEGNRFVRNTVGIVADGANRLQALGNRFEGNGWAVKLLQNTEEARFTANDFLGNTFDVASNGTQNSTRFDGNYWSDYAGYDLDDDGVGDVPHHPVRLFSLVVEQNAPALVLLHSMFIGLLDAAERVLPALTPATLVDERPRMRLPTLDTAPRP